MFIKYTAEEKYKEEWLYAAKEAGMAKSAQTARMLGTVNVAHRYDQPRFCSCLISEFPDGKISRSRVCTLCGIDRIKFDGQEFVTECEFYARARAEGTTVHIPQNCFTHGHEAEVI